MHSFIQVTPTRTAKTKRYARPTDIDKNKAKKSSRNRVDSSIFRSFVV